VSFCFRPALFLKRPLFFAAQVFFSFFFSSCCNDERAREIEREQSTKAGGCGEKEWASLCGRRINLKKIRERMFFCAFVGAAPALCFLSFIRVFFFGDLFA